MRNYENFFQSGFAILRLINKYQSSGGSVSLSTFDDVKYNCGFHLHFLDD